MMQRGGFDWSDGRVRVAAYVVSLVLVAGLAVVVAKAAGAQGMPPPVLHLPSVEDTGPKAKDAPMGVMFAGEVLPAAQVEAVVRQQDLAYLERVVASKKPKPPAGMRIGVVVGKAFDPGCEATVYLSGWVVEKATRVDVTVDTSVPVQLTPTVTMAGYPKAWKWCIPAKYQDGKDHNAYFRAMAGTALIGPSDNATSLNRYVFNIPATVVAPAPPPEPAPVPVPPPPMAFVVGRAYYSGGVVTVEAKPEYTRAELLIDSRDVSPWYQGTKTLVNGKAEFALPAAAKDNVEHLLDVRLYKADAPGVFRPDGYPIRATLNP